MVGRFSQRVGEGGRRRRKRRRKKKEEVEEGDEAKFFSDDSPQRYRVTIESIGRPRASSPPTENKRRRRSRWAPSATDGPNHPAGAPCQKNKKPGS